MMNKEEIDEIPTGSNLRTIGSNYYLASYIAGLYNITSGGTIDAYGYNNPHGVRPVVVLKDNTLTTGKITDAVGQVAWSLVAL